MPHMEITAQTKAFVAAHRNDDVRALALSAKPMGGLDIPFALDQIAGRRIASVKLPQWAACDDIVYPAHISMEQCSSEFTARYKAEIACRLCNLPHQSDTVTDNVITNNADTTMVDLTGGFGVDFSYMGAEFAHAIYVERQPHLCELAEHNMRALGLNQARIINADAIEYLQSMQPVDLIFVDPARRDAHGGRTYAIEDCTPNVLALCDALLEKAPHIIIKLSPMLDWRKTVADFHGHVSEIHIVSTSNECKELLLVLQRGTATDPQITCINDDQKLQYRASESTCGMSVGGAPLPEIRYIYEPNASIMKAGCFDLVEQRYDVTQIGPSSHLMVAEQKSLNFPGRGFVVDAIAGMGKKDVKTLLQDVTHANIAVRNMPISAADLRKKLKLKDGGDVYVFATTMQGGRRVLIKTHKIA